MINHTQKPIQTQLELSVKGGIPLEDSILRLENITKVYSNGVVANKDISVDFRRGEIHSIVGENGAGKSTLMKILFGIEQPSAGKLILRGEERAFHNSLEAIDAGIGMVHQHFMLIPSFTVAQSIVLGIESVRLRRHAGLPRSTGKSSGNPISFSGHNNLKILN